MSLPASPAPLLPPPAYDAALYVGRPTPGSDTAVDQIRRWVDERRAGSGKAICRVEAPPGYGKSWTLARFAEEQRAQPAQPRAPVFLFGPLTLEIPLTPSWFDAQARTLLTKHYGFTARYDPRAAFVNHLVALIDDLEQLDPVPHLLVIVDDVDQVSDLAEAEEKFLGPLVSLSRRHKVSLLLALRSEFGFQRVEELRQRDKYELVRLDAFVRAQAERQLVQLIAYYQARPGAATRRGDPAALAAAMLDALPGYQWGIPALNAELCRAALTSGSSSNIQWTRTELDQCILRALRLDPASGQDRELLGDINLLHSKEPDEWTTDTLGEALGISLMDAARFRNRLQRFNMVERPPEAALGTYRFSAHWQAILESASLIPAH